MKKIWQIWKYSLGSFSDDKTAPYDNYVTLIRTIIFVSYMVTNTFILSGVIRHWNDNESYNSKFQIYGCKNMIDSVIANT
jgi:hypothetical protein